jgi:hypothetical protein
MSVRASTATRGHSGDIYLVVPITVPSIVLSLVRAEFESTRESAGSVSLARPKSGLYAVSGRPMFSGLMSVNDADVVAACSAEATAWSRQAFRTESGDHVRSVAQGFALNEFGSDEMGLPSRQTRKSSNVGVVQRRRGEPCSNRRNGSASVATLRGRTFKATLRTIACLWRDRPHPSHPHQAAR